MDQALSVMEGWALTHSPPGTRCETMRLPGRTPLLFMEVPGSGEDSGDACVLLYGHLDKQPEMTGWADDLGPWLPVIKDGKLYGRGGADTLEGGLGHNLLDGGDSDDIAAYRAAGFVGDHVVREHEMHEGVMRDGLRLHYRR